MKDPAHIVKRFEQVYGTRHTVEEAWVIIERFIMPYRGRFFERGSSEGSVEWRQREIYDSTAVMAAQSLAASLHGSLTTPAIRWFDLRFRDGALQDDSDAVEWLEECSRRVFDALQDSNFNLEANETYLDLVGYGTSIIVEEPKLDHQGAWGGLMFTSVPLKEAYFEQDANGQVYAFYRLLQWTPSRYIDKFGEKHVPEIIRDRYESDPDGRIDVIFCVYPEPANADADVSKALAPERRPYQFAYVTRQGAEPIGGPAGSGGYYEMPAFVPRWRKTSESAWGNSPAMVALADVLTLNQVIEMRIKAVERLIDPPQKVEERALLSDLNLRARGVTVLRDINKLAPLDTGANIQAGEIEIADLRRAIRQYFFVDQLELKESPAMTATEVQVRYEMMQRLLGPTLGRLQSDFLDPMIQRTFNILLRAGRLPEIPQSVKAAAAHMDIDYLGPLSRAQRTDQVASTERWLMNLAQLAQVLPDMLDIPDPEQIARQIAQMLSVPAKMLRSTDEVAEIREARAAAQAAQIKAQQMQMQGEGMRAIGEGASALNNVSSTVPMEGEE
jgi:hypothetical protein